MAIAPERRHLVSAAYGRELSDQKTTETTLLTTESVVAGVAHSCLRGWRLSMEDEAVLELLTPALGCFAVLDGHGGSFCSRWGADELPRRLHHIALLVERSTEADEARQVAQQLSEAVRQMDADLRTRGRPAWACGSTLVVLLVTERSLTVANLGDSRAVLCRAGMALPLSRDHKPKSAAERQRILQAGGFIVDGRVNGDLSLSRALGDFRHKCVANLPPAKQPISAEPEVRCTARLRTDLFVVLACDGVWDVMSSADVVAFVAQFLERAPVATGANAAAPPPATAPPHGAAAAMKRSEQEAATCGAACAAHATGNGVVGGIGSGANGANGHGYSSNGQGGGAAASAGGRRTAAAGGTEEQRVATGLIMERLLDECLRRGSTDNISAVLVLLEPSLRPREPLLQAARLESTPPLHALPALVGGVPRSVHAAAQARVHTSMVPSPTRALPPGEPVPAAAAMPPPQQQQPQQPQTQPQTQTASLQSASLLSAPPAPTTSGAPCASSTLANGNGAQAHHGLDYGNGAPSATLHGAKPCGGHAGSTGLPAPPFERSGAFDSLFGSALAEGLALGGVRSARRALMLVCVLLTCLTLAGSQLLTAGAPTPITVVTVAHQRNRRQPRPKLASSFKGIASTGPLWRRANATASAASRRLQQTYELAYASQNATTLQMRVTSERARAPSITDSPPHRGTSARTVPLSM